MKLRSLFLLSALTLATPLMAFADSAPTPGGQPGMDRPDRPSPAVMQHLADGRIAFIEAALALNSDQQKLWQPVAELLRQQSDKHAQGDHPPFDRHATLSDLLSRHASEMSTRADSDQKLATALKSLEETLTVEQKETLKIAFFVTMPRPAGPHHMGRGPSDHDGPEGKAPGNEPADNGAQPG
jgi:hypothetical protein